MRIRTIKPEFWVSESMGRLRRDTRLLFVGLWSLADDHGRFRSDPRYIAGQLFPYDSDGLRVVDRGLAELALEQCVTLFEAGGSQYGAVTGWSKHQRIDRKSEPKLPGPDDSSSMRLVAGTSLASPRRALVEGSSVAREPSSQDQGRDQGRDQGSGIREAPAAVAAGKKPRKPKAQAELPEIIPPAPPREPSRGEVLFQKFRENREDHLTDVLEVEAHPDGTYAPAFVNKVFKGWFELWAHVPFSEKWSQVGLINGAEVRCIQLFNAFLELDWPAKCVARVDGKDTETPQPYPFSALASEKVWRPLVAALWPDEQPQAGAA